MTREKKIELDNKIKSMIYLYMLKQGAFDYWLDENLFYEVANLLQCSVHKVKRVFFKQILVENYQFVKNLEY